MQTKPKADPLSDAIQAQQGNTEAARRKGNLPQRGTGRSVWFTGEEFPTIERALKVIRVMEGDATITDGRALELIAADFLSGVREEECNDESSLRHFPES